MGWTQKNPIQVDSTTAVGVINNSIMPKKLNALARECSGFVTDLTHNNFEHIGPLKKEIIPISHPSIIKLYISYIKDHCVLGCLIIFLLK